MNFRRIPPDYLLPNIPSTDSARVLIQSRDHLDENEKLECERSDSQFIRPVHLHGIAPEDLLFTHFQQQINASTLNTPMATLILGIPNSSHRALGL